MNPDVSEIYQLRIPTVLGPTLGLDEFRGKAVLIVNTASACGFAPQMKSLQALHAAHAAAGFSVIGVPSNDFNQEPLSDGTLAAQACERYGVEFPLLDVPHVKGKHKHALFATLTAASRGWLGREILWNFEKFLVGRDGRLLGRWRSISSPGGQSIQRAVAAAVKGS